MNSFVLVFDGQSVDSIEPEVIIPGSMESRGVILSLVGGEILLESGHGQVGGGGSCVVQHGKVHPTNAEPDFVPRIMSHR